MKRALILFFMASVAQESLLLSSSKDLSQYILGGGFGNLDKHLKDSVLSEKCLEVSRPWNKLYNAFTINNSSDCSACEALNEEFFNFQQEFLKEVPQDLPYIIRLFSKEKFCSKYLEDHRREHEFKISTVFDPNVRIYGLNKQSDPRIIIAVDEYQNALKKSIENL